MTEVLHEREHAREDEWVRREQEHPLSGDELRAAIDAMGISYTRAALQFGLSVDGLHKQMCGAHAVSLQTQLLLDRRFRGFVLDEKLMALLRRKNKAIADYKPNKSSDRDPKLDRAVSELVDGVCAYPLRALIQRYMEFRASKTDRASAKDAPTAGQPLVTRATS
jgi:hypothetical protein